MRDAVLKSIEFRRVYTLNFDEGDTRLEYSHSDLIVELDSGAPAMAEIIPSQLNAGECNVDKMYANRCYCYCGF